MNQRYSKLDDISEQIEDEYQKSQSKFTSFISYEFDGNNR